MDIIDAQYFIEKEKEAENYAVPFIEGVHFTDCLRMNLIETELEVDVKESTRKLQAHRIYGLWETYLAATGEVTKETITTKTKGGKIKTKPVVKQPSIFTGFADDHMKKMYTWLTTEYTDMYKAISTKAECTWLETVIRFTVLRRIMENKYKRWITTGSGFADPGVAARVAEIYRMKYVLPELARVVNSVFLKHKERTAEDWERRMAQDVIMGVFDLLRSDPVRLLPPVKPNNITTLIEGSDAV